MKCRNTTEMLAKLMMVELDATYPADARRVIRDERMRLQVAVRAATTPLSGGETAGSWGHVVEVARQVAETVEMWGVEV